MTQRWAVVVEARRKSGIGGALAALLTVAALVGLVIPASAAAADSVYWTDEGGGPNLGEVRVGNLDGSGSIQNMFQNENFPAGVAIDPAAGKIYWTAFGPTTALDGIRVGNLDGSGGASDLFTGEVRPSGLAIDPAAGKLYWTEESFNETNGEIRVGNLDGSGTPTTLFSGQDKPRGVAIDPAAGKIYWTDYGNGRIMYGNLDGSGGAQLLTSDTPEGPIGIAVDASTAKVYWSLDVPSGSGAIRVGEGGGYNTLFESGLSAGPRGLAIDSAAGKLYWADHYSAVRVGNIDGSGSFSDLFSGGQAEFAALLLSPAAAGVPQVSGAGEVGQLLSCSRGSWASDLPGAFLFRAPRSFSYQWLLNGSPVAGATQASLTPSAAGSYACRVTATNHAGSTAQASAAVQVSAVPAPAPTPPSHGTAFAVRVALIKRGKALLKLRCRGGPCRGVVKLIDRVKVKRVVRRHGHRRVVRRHRRALLGKARFSIPAGKTRLVRVQLNRRGKHLLRHAGRLKVRLAGRDVRHRTELLKPARHRHH